MSWVASCIRLEPKEAAKVIEQQFSSQDAYPCVEPEESIRQDARKLIAKVLEANVDGAKSVEVSAYGSMSTVNGKASSSLSIKITPYYD